MPFDKVPILEVDGKTLSQSINILQYVSRETGWYKILNLSMYSVTVVPIQRGIIKRHGTDLEFVSA